MQAKGREELALVCTDKPINTPGHQLPLDTR